MSVLLPLSSLVEFSGSWAISAHMRRLFVVPELGVPELGVPKVSARITRRCSSSATFSSAGFLNAATQLSMAYTIAVTMLLRVWVACVTVLM